MSDNTCCPDLEAGAHADDCAERPAVEFLGRFGGGVVGESGHLAWGDMPYDNKSIAEVIHDYAVVRGDLTEQYARDQLTEWIERLVRQKQAQALRDAADVTSAEPGCTCCGVAACPQCQERDAKVSTPPACPHCGYRDLSRCSICAGLLARGGLSVEMSTPPEERTP